MNKNNSVAQNKFKAYFKNRWFVRDTPESEPRFKSNLLARDFGVFLAIPIMTLVFWKMCENAIGASERTKVKKRRVMKQKFSNEIIPQIISFTSENNKKFVDGIKIKSIGTLVRIKLLNRVEVYGSSPVHAQIVGIGLGKALRGSRLIGEAVADETYNRITINFNILRTSRGERKSYRISARALSLNGTFGLEAQRGKNLITRAALRTKFKMDNENDESKNLIQMIISAIFDPLSKELNKDIQEKRRLANVLMLSPPKQFFAELLEQFPNDK